MGRIIQGSTRIINVKEEPTPTRLGLAITRTSDDYSVFDAKKMSDTIPLFGEARNMFSAYVLEALEKEGIPTHYQELLDLEGNSRNVKGINKPTPRMRINLYQVIPLTFDGKKYDYSGYSSEQDNFLLPLELIVRNKLPKGSSIFGRLERAELFPEDLGLDHYPQEEEILPRPYLDCTTKLERKDRPLRWREAQELAQIDDSQLYAVQTTLSKVNEVLQALCGRMGFELEDFKVEMGLSQGKVHILDNIDPDGCRLKHKASGVSFSKQPLRDYFITTSWYPEVKRAKEIAAQRGVEEFMQFCPPAPVLPGELREIASQMYASITNALYQRELFKGIPSVDQVAERYLKWKAGNQ